MKIAPAPYTPVKKEQAVSPAPAKAEEKTSTVRSDHDKVELGSSKKETAVTYAPPKKLTSDQVRGIREALTAQQTQLLQAMAGNSINQANSFLASIGGKSPNGGFVSNGKLPPLATTQEGALAAISEGGAYSVDAVATRIFDMAKSMAGDDPEMLKKMQDAVKKGFEAAGLDFKGATGQGLPDISRKTYDEVMDRFDKRFAELDADKDSEKAEPAD